MRMQIITRLLLQILSETLWQMIANKTKPLTSQNIYTAQTKRQHLKTEGRQIQGKRPKQ